VEILGRLLKFFRGSTGSSHIALSEKDELLTDLQPDETTLIGKWVSKGGDMRGDEVTKRIRWLVAKRLKKLTISKDYGAWEILFVDPGDGRYWEQTYPQGYMHGGGPPALIHLSEDEARKKYDF